MLDGENIRVKKKRKRTVLEFIRINLIELQLVDYTFRKLEVQYVILSLFFNNYVGPIMGPV